MLDTQLVPTKTPEGPLCARCHKHSQTLDSEVCVYCIIELSSRGFQKFISVSDLGVGEA